MSKAVKNGVWCREEVGPKGVRQKVAVVTQTEVPSASFTPGEAPRVITLSSSHRDLWQQTHCLHRGVATQMIVSVHECVVRTGKACQVSVGVWTGLVAPNTKNAFWGKTRYYLVLRHLTQSEACHRSTVIGDCSSAPASVLDLHWLWFFLSSAFPGRKCGW